MQTCIVPVISYNYATKNLKRCKEILTAAVIFGIALMSIGTLCFELIPEQMLRVFTSDELVVEIGSIGFRFIGIAFIPMVTSLIFPVFFQAVESGLISSMLTIIRTVFLFVPLGYLFSRLGLQWFWMTFLIAETITTLVGFIFCFKFFRHNHSKILWEERKIS